MVVFSKVAPPHDFAPDTCTAYTSSSSLQSDYFMFPDTVYIPRAVKLSQCSCLFESISNRIKTNRKKNQNKKFLQKRCYLPFPLTNMCIESFYSLRMTQTFILEKGHLATLHSNMLSRSHVDKTILNINSTCAKFRQLDFSIPQKSSSI